MSDAVYIWLAGFSLAASLLGPIALAVAGHIRSKSIEKKVDDNTKVTKDGTETAANNAKTAADVATKAKETVERVDSKTDKIVDQTNGSLDAMGELLKLIVGRVDKLEEYNRGSAHRTLDAVNAMHLKIEKLVVLMEKEKNGA